VRRIRWFDPEFGEPSTPVAWPAASLILATVFLNPVFLELLSSRFWPTHPLPVHAVILATIAATVTAAFYVGPAMAMLAARRPLREVAADHLGTIPGLILRVCMLGYLLLWAGALIGIPLRIAANSWRPEPMPLVVGLAAGVAMAFVFVTAHQRESTEARLAMVSCKLFVAITIAAFLRVQDGWPAILGWYKGPGPWRDIQFGVSDVAKYAAPAALLAADLSYRMRGRRDVMLTGCLGMGLPLFGALLISGLLCVVTHASWLYQPSLAPTLAMSLFSKMARSAVPGRALVIMVTMFGAVRFAARCATRVAGIRHSLSWRQWVIPAGFLAATAWCSVRLFDPAFDSVFDWLGRILGVTGAVITAGVAVGQRQCPIAGRIDWVGTGSLLAGLATPLFIPHGPLMYGPHPWWWPWLLPSCAVAFTICVPARLVEKKLARKR
jgi:hypothetical protein